jgi:hypothetical protein
MGLYTIGFKQKSWKTTTIVSVNFVMLKQISIKLEDIRDIFAPNATPILMQKNLWQNIIPIKSNCLIGKEF